MIIWFLTGQIPPAAKWKTCARIRKDNTSCTAQQRKRQSDIMEVKVRNYLKKQCCFISIILHGLRVQKTLWWIVGNRTEHSRVTSNFAFFITAQERSTCQVEAAMSKMFMQSAEGKEGCYSQVIFTSYIILVSRGFSRHEFRCSLYRNP